MKYMMKEAYLEFNDESSESAAYMIQKITNYLSEKKGLKLEARHKSSKLEISIYPLTAEDALTLSDEIGELLHRDIDFRIRTHIGKECLS